MADGPAWAWSDAWVLAAVAAYGERGCSLTELIAAGDAINHAMLLAAEVEQGVRRLSGTGLITVQEEVFGLTDRGRDLVTGRPGGLHGQVGHLLAGLRRVPVVER